MITNDQIRALQADTGSDHLWSACEAALDYTTEDGSRESGRAACTQAIFSRGYTADQLITLRAAAANMLRRFLAESEAEIREGMRLGFLADSGLDALRFTSDAPYTVHCTSILSGPGFRCMVRVEDEFTIQDFILSPQFVRPFIPGDYWTITEGRVARRET